MSLAATLGLVAEALTAQQAGFALVGGLAVSVRTEPRFTRDIDLAVAVADDTEAEQRARGLAVAGFVIDTVVEQRAQGRLATVRLVPPGGPSSVVDLLFGSSGIEPELVERAGPVEVFAGITVPVAQIGDLIALKLLSEERDRPLDAVDLRSLGVVAGEADWQLAEASCALIEERGFHRHRDLRSGLRALRDTTTR